MLALCFVQSSCHPAPVHALLVIEAISNRHTSSVLKAFTSLNGGREAATVDIVVSSYGLLVTVPGKFAATQLPA